MKKVKPKKNNLQQFLKIFLLLTFLYSSSFVYADNWGTLLGDFNGVNVYSNGSTSYYDDTANNYHNNIYTGKKWQCVEFVNRYFVSTYGIDFRQYTNLGIGHANTYYNASANIPGVTTHANGSVAPQVGDLLCSNNGDNGHVAIVREVGSTYIKVTHQNWTNTDNDLDTELPRNGNTIGEFGSGYHVVGLVRANSESGSSTPTVSNLNAQVFGNNIEGSFYLTTGSTSAKNVRVHISNSNGVYSGVATEYLDDYNFQTVFSSSQTIDFTIPLSATNYNSGTYKIKVEAWDEYHNYQANVEEISINYTTGSNENQAPVMTNIHGSIVGNNIVGYFYIYDSESDYVTNTRVHISNSNGIYPPNEPTEYLDDYTYNSLIPEGRIDFTIPLSDLNGISGTYKIKIEAWDQYHNNHSSGTKANVQEIQIEYIAGNDFYIQNAMIQETSVLVDGQIHVECDQYYTGTSGIILYPALIYLLSINTSYDSYDIILDDDESSLKGSDLYDNENETIRIPEDIPAGEYYLLFYADGNNDYQETNEDNNVVAIPITVLSPTRIISLNGSLSFEDEEIGTTSVSKTLTITNNGNSTLQIQGINCPTGFSKDWNGGNISAGSSQNVNITFSPTSAINYADEITVTSDATSGNNTISISGTGVEPPNELPTVVISSPSNNVTVNSLPVTISGTAQDTDGSISAVEIKIDNTGVWENAIGTSNWNKEISLTEGEHTIFVRAKDNDNEYSTTQQVTITYEIPCPTPVANFDFHLASINVNSAVQFTNTSEAGTNETINSDSWSFGDGQNSTETSPEHIYTSAGVYTVSLTVTNSCGESDIETKTNIITVSEVPNEIPTINILSHSDNDEVTTSNITLEGNMQDTDGTITSVEINVNSSDTWETATLTSATNWTKDLTLIAGENIIQVKAKDDDNVYSELQTIHIIYNEPSTPTVDWEYPNSNEFENNMQITVQISLDDVAVQSGILYAFDINGNCIGMKEIQFTPSGYYLSVGMFIYFNEPTCETYFKYVNEAGEIYDLQEILTVESDENLGDIFAPIELHYISNITIEIPFYEGYIWRSFPFENDDMTINTNLGVDFDENDFIKNGNTSSQFYNQPTLTGWYEDIILTKETMYKCKMANAHTVIIETMPLDLENIELTIQNGWNYLSYLPLTSMNIDEALANLDIQHGDFIKSKNGSMSQYYFTDIFQGWFPDDFQFNPYEGYMFKSNYAEDRTFTYPASDNNNKKHFVSNFVENDFTQYPENMNMFIQINGLEYLENAKLLAYHNEELRGKCTVTHFEPMNTDLFLMTIHGNGQETNEEISFKLQLANGEILEISNTILFGTDVIMGNMLTPFVMNLQTSAIEKLTKMDISLYPNPATNEVFISIPQGFVNGTLSIKNILGKVILRENLENINFRLNISNIEQGYYLVVFENSKYQIIKKLVIK